MTDKQLLKDAAKAAGIKLVFDSYGLPRDCTGMAPAMNILSAKVWNPIDDDGDALWLSVMLRLSVQLSQRISASWVCNDRGDNIAEVQHDDAVNFDPYAATRRAIVMAAAEIGRSKT
jgi:hypothetical protein